MTYFARLPLAILLLTGSLQANSQQTFSAGSQLQQVRPALVIPPDSLSPLPIADRLNLTPAPGDPRTFLVRNLAVDGTSTIKAQELIERSGFNPGSHITFDELLKLGAKMEELLHSRGYFLARVNLPEQTVSNGIFTFIVSEGRYGSIAIKNKSSLSDFVHHRILSDIQSGDAVLSSALERQLLLLSDLPGVVVTSTLSPGVEAGTSDLHIELDDAVHFTGNVNFDNQGNAFTGYQRYGVTLTSNNPLGLGDSWAIQGMTTGAGLNYTKLSYLVPFGAAKLGVSYAGLAYQLHGLALKGTAGISSLTYVYPLIRSRSNNVSAVLSIDEKSFHDPKTLNGNKFSSVWSTGVHGDFRDLYLGGSVNSYLVNLSGGVLDLQTPSVLETDMLTSRRNGSFTKLLFSAKRVQGFNEMLSASGSFKGQWASKNLDSSEQFTLGGANAVRAYPEGAGSSDQGYVVSLETRLSLPPLSSLVTGRLQIIGFVDYGSSLISKLNWNNSVNRKSFAGVGVGIDWNPASDYLLKAYYSKSLNVSTTAPASGLIKRFSLEVVKQF